ncbi:NAD-P-binding protein [Abortiporus biennis]|nr:NAD-P-binding protein [Abortiporus biennis]
MTAVAQKLLVVGGNGFVGSAVCKAALARGMQVTSISSSGKPYTTPKGHSPAWTSKVDWKAGDALRPETYAHLLPGTTAVVHTLGTLLEDPKYKAALKNGDISALFGALTSGVTRSRNPLEDHTKSGSYEVLNRDAALRVCETFVATESEKPLDKPRPFIYVSAEDVFRPFISPRYIETKREAELGIQDLMVSHPNFRGVYIRPSLIYHPHFRPLTTPIAAALDLSVNIHARVPRGLPTPGSILRSLSSAFSSGPSSSLISPSPLESVANALTIPPIHVDHVAEAICIAVEDEHVNGVYGVNDMRALIGWAAKGNLPATQSSRLQDGLKTV